MWVCDEGHHANKTGTHSLHVITQNIVICRNDLFFFFFFVNYNTLNFMIIMCSCSL